MNLTSFADVAAAAAAANPTMAKGSGSTDIALLTSPTAETEYSNVSDDANGNIKAASQFSHAERMELIATLSKEISQLKKETKAMNQKCRLYQKRDQGRKAEVVSLRARLEDIDSNYSYPNQHSSTNGDTAALKPEEAACVKVTDLDDDTESKLEAALKHLTIVEAERDILKLQLKAMKEFPPFTSGNTTSDPIVASLKQKLEKAQKQYIDVVAENHALKTELRSLNNGQGGVSQLANNTGEEATKKKGGFIANLMSRQRIKRRQRH